MSKLPEVGELVPCPNCGAEVETYERNDGEIVYKDTGRSSTYLLLKPDGELLRDTALVWLLGYRAKQRGEEVT